MYDQIVLWDNYILSGILIFCFLTGISGSLWPESRSWMIFLSVAGLATSILAFAPVTEQDLLITNTLLTIKQQNLLKNNVEQTSNYLSYLDLRERLDLIEKQTYRGKP